MNTTEAFNNLWKLISEDPLLIPSFLTLLAAIYLLFKSQGFREINEKILQTAFKITEILTDTFFIKESKNYDSAREFERTIEEYKNRIKESSKLEEKIAAKLNEKDINEKIEEYVKLHLQKQAESVVVKRTTSISGEKIIRDLIGEKFDTLVKEYINDENNYSKIIHLERIKQQNKSFENLNNIINNQYSSAQSTKKAITNIFILGNICLLTFYFFFIRDLDEKLILTMSLTHIGLSAFMIYIIKTSNNRISSLMAVSEDTKKTHDFYLVIEMLNKQEAINEHSVAALKILMTNHSEREKQTLHPYEMAFKGINNSSIQFKGGKVEFEKK